MADEWAKDPATLELLFHAALGDGDTRGVEAALRLLAVADPHRCRELIDLTRMALIVAGADR